MPDTSSGHSVFALEVCDTSTGFTRTRTQFYNAARFAQPGPGQYGTARNAVRQPARMNTSVSLFKAFAITELVRAQLRAEAFGIFNHAILGTGGNNKGFTNAPALTAVVEGQRVLQLSQRGLVLMDTGRARLAIVAGVLVVSTLGIFGLRYCCPKRSNSG